MSLLLQYVLLSPKGHTAASVREPAVAAVSPLPADKIDTQIWEGGILRSAMECKARKKIVKEVSIPVYIENWGSAD